MFSSRHPCPRTHAHTTPPGSMLVVVMMIVVWGSLARKNLSIQKVEGSMEKNPELPDIPNAYFGAGFLAGYMAGAVYTVIVTAVILAILAI